LAQAILDQGSNSFGGLHKVAAQRKHAASLLRAASQSLITRALHLHDA